MQSVVTLCDFSALPTCYAEPDGRLWPETAIEFDRRRFSSPLHYQGRHTKMFSSLFRSSIPNEALEFAGFVLAHCAAIADSNRGGELICPFAVLEGDGGREVVDFESETQEEAVSKGWASLGEAKSNTVSWAFGREGLYREPGGSAVDVLTVTVWMPGMNEHYSVQQYFGRREDRAIYLSGAPKLLKHKGDHAESVEHWNEKAVERGIAMHRKGTMWSQWCAQ